MTRPHLDDRTNWHTIATRAFTGLAIVVGLFAVALIASAVGV